MESEERYAIIAERKIRIGEVDEMAGQKPKYLVLVDWVKEQIEKGELIPGQKLHSENELTAMFQISRQTVRHAIAILENEGIIEKKRGSGTYINNLFQKERGKSTMNIAVITTYVDDYIFPGIIQAVEKVVSKAGYTIQLSFTHNSVEKERAVLHNILQKNMIDGIIMETTKSGIPNHNVDLYDEIIRRDIPVVFLNSYYPDVSLPHVSLDDRQAGKMITEYLIGQGHDRIAGIFKADDGQGHLRYAGYVDALISHNIRVRDEHIIWVDTEDVNNLNIISKKILNRLKNCSACVCYNDEVAKMMLSILKKGGIKVPEDMSLTGIDNSDLAELCEVPLTSVVYPVGQLGEKAAENLLALIEDKEFDANYEFEPFIKVRQSVKQKQSKI